MMRRLRRQPSRPAFVLPFVILLMLVVGLTATVMLARSDVQTRDVRRMLDAYATHHAALGIQTAIEAWLVQLGRTDLAEHVDADGFALALDPGDGTELRLHFFPAQGLVRDNLDGGPPGISDLLYPVIDELAARTAAVPDPGETLADAAPGVFRSVGPWQISLRAMPERVIDAVAFAVASDANAGALAEGMRQAQRSEEPLERETLARIATEAELDTEEQTAFLNLVVPTGTLWEVVIDVYTVTSPTPAARYRALANVRTAVSTESPYERPPPFLTWQRETPGEIGLTVPPKPTGIRPSTSGFRGPAGRADAGSRGDWPSRDPTTESTDVGIAV